MAATIAIKEKLIKKVPVKKAAMPASSADDNRFAIIETGGKQYRVAAGETIKIEKIKVKGGGEMKEGDEVVFDKVLLIDNGASTDIGAPYIVGSKVASVITEIGRNQKVVVIHYKQKSRYFKKAGHRQPFFKVKITTIS
jgi:large subunit ribosomal protein L21